jgi:predicted nucleic acid-binding protein
MIYCETSFLLPLYAEGDSFHARARGIAAKFREPLPYTLLLELELQNGIRRALATGTLNQQQHDAAFRRIEEDESDGILQRRPLDSAQHYAKARELSKKFTPDLGVRSLDILQVAAAMLLKAESLASFDDRQRRLAEKAGLKLLPRQL